MTIVTKDFSYFVFSYINLKKKKLNHDKLYSNDFKKTIINLKTHVKNINISLKFSFKTCIMCKQYQNPIMLLIS